MNHRLTTLAARAALHALAALALAPDAARAQAAAPPAGTTLLTVADTMLFPEGIVRDEARSRWLLSSILHRTIIAVDDRGRSAPFARDLPSDVGAIFGMRVDAARGVLLAASGAVPQMARYAPADTLRAEILEFDLATGALKRRIALPAAPRQRMPGDLVIGRDGTLYVTDGMAARIYVVPREGASRTIESALFRSPQGAVLAPDERSLILADYSNGLLHVPLTGTDTVAMITDSAGRRLRGVDGLYARGGDLIATYNGRRPGMVFRVTLTADRRAIRGFTTLETVPGAGEPTLGVILGDAFVFIANSPWSAFDEKGARVPGSTMAPPELRRLPLAP